MMFFVLKFTLWVTCSCFLEIGLLLSFNLRKIFKQVENNQYGKYREGKCKHIYSLIKSIRYMGYLHYEVFW